MTERLGELLIHLGALRPEDLARALRLKAERGGRLGETLLALSLVDEDTLLKALARQKRVPFAEARWFDAVEPRLIKLITRRHAVRHKLIPLRLMDKRLVVATCDADNLDRLPSLEEAVGQPLRPVLARRADVDRALGRYYRSEDGTAEPAEPLDVQLLVRRKDPASISSGGMRPSRSFQVPPASPPAPRPASSGSIRIPSTPPAAADNFPAATIESLPVATIISQRPTPPGRTDEIIRGEHDAELRDLFASRDVSDSAMRVVEEDLLEESATNVQALPAFTEDPNRTLMDMEPLQRNARTQPEAQPLSRGNTGSGKVVIPADTEPISLADLPVQRPGRATPPPPPLEHARPVTSPRAIELSLPPANILSGPSPFDDADAGPTRLPSTPPRPPPPPPAEPRGEGERFGNYTLLRRIKAGGMAEVYLAKTGGVEGFEKRVAIKRILPHLTESNEFVEMFIDEAKLTVQLNHANIAHIYDFGKRDNTYYIAMEFIHGRDVNAIFKDAYKRKEPLPISVCAFIIQQICEGLDYAHRKKGEDLRDLGIVHRDISPANILVSYEGAVKIIDFGIAKAVSKLSMTRPGLIKGKISYMSPEQMRGQPIDRRSDVFAVGIILYELIASRRLFAARTDVDTIRNVIKGNIPPLESVRPDVPAELVQIVMKALQSDPDQRFGWASEMSAALQGFMLKHGMTNARTDLMNHMVAHLREAD